MARSIPYRVAGKIKNQSAANITSTNEPTNTYRAHFQTLALTSPPSLGSTPPLGLPSAIAGAASPEFLPSGSLSGTIRAISPRSTPSGSTPGTISAASPKVSSSGALAATTGAASTRSLPSASPLGTAG